jgi:hypothetical protein
VSIIRVGLSETERFATGYDAIFRGRRAAGKKKPAVAKKKASAKKKSPAKKKKPIRPKKKR